MNQFEEELRVCVTKELPRIDLEPIIRRFIDQRLTFGVSRSMRGRFILWRAPMQDEFRRTYNNCDNRGHIIETSPDLLETRNFVELYVGGRFVRTE